MRTAVFFCLFLGIGFCLFASAQTPGIDNSEVPSTNVEPVGGANLWSYMIFIIGTLVTVYFVFRGNKRA